MNLASVLLPMGVFFGLLKMLLNTKKDFCLKLVYIAWEFKSSRQDRKRNPVSLLIFIPLSMMQCVVGPKYPRVNENGAIGSLCKWTCFAESILQRLSAKNLEVLLGGKWDKVFNGQGLRQRHKEAINVKHTLAKREVAGFDSHTHHLLFGFHAKQIFSGKHKCCQAWQQVGPNVVVGWHNGDLPVAASRGCSSWLW